MVNYEVKGQLAKLLATEDLTIENRSVPTAQFDVHRRVLTLPLWERASGTVYDLLVGHEVGHALFTPDINWKKTHPEVPQNFVNIFEDVRVERKMKQKFAGLSKTFYNGYNELSQEDFFGIEDEQIDLLSLVDRINLHYKIGNFVSIPFSDEEMVYVKKAQTCESFNQVLDLSQEVYDYLKKQSEEQEVPSTPEKEQAKPNYKSQEGDSDKVESSDNVDNDQGSSKPQQSGDSEVSSKTNENPVGGDTFETITDKNLEESIEDLNNEDNLGKREPEYIEIPDIDLDAIVAKNSEIHEYLTEYYQNIVKIFSDVENGDQVFDYVDTGYAKFKKNAQREVGYLVKEFECRKSASAYARSSVSRTGVLDCSKLHTYKYNEDLFKKVTTVADGKNHGLVFVLDWSGSMSDVLLDTIKQLYNLIWFCRKVSIPFDVYAFTNEWKPRNYDDSLPYPGERVCGEFYIDPTFSMMNILTSNVRGNVLEMQMKNLYRLASSMDHRERYRCAFQYPSHLSLSGTPLNEAVLSLNKIIPEFKKRSGVEKVQTIVLTDGEACITKFNKEIPCRRNDEESYMGVRSCHGGWHYIRDRKTGLIVKVKQDFQGVTQAILTQVRSRFPNTNFIGIRILASRDANSFIRRYCEYDSSVADKIIEYYKKNKSFVIPEVGYNAYFGLSSSALSNDSEFEVKDDATKAQIRSAFKKSLSSKKMNKKVLGEFVQLIA